MKIAVVILNWNTEGFLKRFLPPLINSVSRIEGAEVIVADNASTDGSLDLMKTEFPDIRTIVLDRNYGFTGGYNKALAQIEAEYHVLINSDIEVQDGWLEPLLEWMEVHPDCGACAPKLHSWQDKDMFEYAGAAGGHIDSFGYPFCRGRILGRVEKDYGQYDRKSPDIFWASGACLMVRSSLYWKLGGLDDRFFAHMEEIDLCWRMQLAGYRVCVVPESTVYHVGGGTLPATSPFKLFLNYRNNLLMLDNNLARTYALRQLKSGADPDEAARRGHGQAKTTIRIRMMLDMMSAAVYLLTLRFKAFNAVLKAHSQFRTMRKGADPDETAAFLKAHGDSNVRGIYCNWIILKSMMSGKIFFAGIKDSEFLNF